MSPDISPRHSERYSVTSVDEQARRLGNVALQPDHNTEVVHRTLDVEPAEANYTPSTLEVAGRMELEHVVKMSPRIEDQASDLDRDNIITRIPHRKGLKTRTSSPEFAHKRVSDTEQQVLARTLDYLHTALEDKYVVDRDGKKDAKSMIDSFTFIGKKEYTEAAAGIADYWKVLLDADVKTKILAVTGEIVKSERHEVQDGPLRTKSDEYLLDTILSNFDDTEMERYGNRLLLDPDEVGVGYTDKLRTILLDDWTISGAQLGRARKTLLERAPHLKSSIEIQLVVADKKRIHGGLRPNDMEKGQSVPVRSYYQAHDAPRAAVSKAHISGFHSSVDYSVEDELSYIRNAAENFLRIERPSVNQKNSLPNAQKLSHLVPIANIVRPYRMEGFELKNIDRYKSLKNQAS